MCRWRLLSPGSEKIDHSYGCGQTIPSPEINLRRPVPNSRSDGSLENLYIEQTRVNGWKVVKIVGEVDTSTASLLQEYLNGLLTDEKQDLALDMSGTAFPDSSGLDLLVRIKNLLQERGRVLALLSPPWRLPGAWSPAGWMGSSRSTPRVRTFPEPLLLFGHHDAVSGLAKGGRTGPAANDRCAEEGRWVGRCRRSLGLGG